MNAHRASIGPAMLDQRRTFESVDDACSAFKAGHINEDTLIEVLSALPTTPQNHLYSEEWRDSWSPVRGPIYDLGQAFDQGLISASVHDRALDAMIKAGHEA